MPINIGGKDYKFPEADQNDYPWAHELYAMLKELGETVSPDYICREEGDLEGILQNPIPDNSTIRVDVDQKLSNPILIRSSGLHIYPKTIGIRLISQHKGPLFRIKVNHVKISNFRLILNIENDLAYFDENIDSADLSGNIRR